MKKTILSFFAIGLAMMSCTQNEFQATGGFDRSSTADTKLLNQLTEKTYPSKDVFLSATKGNYYFQSALFLCKDTDGERQYIPAYKGLDAKGDIEEMNWLNYIEGDASVPVIRFSEKYASVCQSFFSSGESEYVQYKTRYSYDEKDGLFSIANPFEFYGPQKHEGEKVKLLHIDEQFVVFKSTTVTNNSQDAEYSIVVFEKRAEEDLANYYNLYGQYKDYR